MARRKAVNIYLDANYLVVYLDSHKHIDGNVKNISIIFSESRKHKDENGRDISQDWPPAD